mmetsp:Transcript_106541/g.211675  ORF Transcript_106541/g.211675 Transcript_106541/m.211675 type:complete len:213 (-) Transcript_106541:457-1095(-)
MTGVASRAVTAPGTPGATSVGELSVQAAPVEASTGGLGVATHGISTTGTARLCRSRMALLEMGRTWPLASMGVSSSVSSLGCVALARRLPSNAQATTRPLLVPWPGPPAPPSGAKAACVLAAWSTISSTWGCGTLSGRGVETAAEAGTATVDGRVACNILRKTLDLLSTTFSSSAAALLAGSPPLLAGSTARKASSTTHGTTCDCGSNSATL